MKDARLQVRLTAEELQIVQGWARSDPEQRGVGAVVRRLIREEVQRERERWARADHNDFA